MNMSGVIRGYMSKNFSIEEFIIHVAKITEKQLQEWDGNYEVFLMKLKDYKFVIKNQEQYFEIYLSENEIELLQNKSPFSLDRKVWIEMEKQGLTIIKGMGDYLDKVFF